MGNLFQEGNPVVPAKSGLRQVRLEVADNPVFVQPEAIAPGTQIAHSSAIGKVL
jgi:hypothetical protein